MQALSILARRTRDGARESRNPGIRNQEFDVLSGRQLWKDGELGLRIDDDRVLKRRARNVDLFDRVLVVGRD
jgi:hypothetical protein